MKLKVLKNTETVVINPIRIMQKMIPSSLMPQFLQITPKKKGKEKKITELSLKDKLHFFGLFVHLDNLEIWHRLQS